jgi:hypothetical protein
MGRSSTWYGRIMQLAAAQVSPEAERLKQGIAKAKDVDNSNTDDGRVLPNGIQLRPNMRRRAHKLSPQPHLADGPAKGTKHLLAHEEWVQMRRV